MAFCTNCGEKLNDGAKFCHSCGKAVEASNNAERKVVFEGEIHKCPNCGEVLGSFVAVCPACGYEIRGVSNSIVVREFAYKLASTESNLERLAIISNFPVPNTKEDIMEFLILASTNCDKAKDVDLVEAWMTKMSQCIQKASFLVAGDNLLQIQNCYSNAIRKAKRRCLAIRVKSSAKKTVARNSSKQVDTTHRKVGYNFFASLVAMIFRNMCVFAALFAFYLTIRIDSQGDNIYGALYVLLGVIFLVMSTFLVYRKSATYGDVLFAVVGVILTFYSRGFMSETNGAMAILGGVVAAITLIPAFIKKLVQK